MTAESSASDGRVAPVPPTVAALRQSLADLITESQALRVDVTAAERARRRSAQINLGLLGLLVIFVGLLITLTWQNNQLAHQVAHTNDVLVDCTSPTGECYRNANARTGQAISDIIRGQSFLAECARLYPGEVGPAFDAKLEECVNSRIADRTRNPIGQPTPPPSTSGDVTAPPAPTPTGGR